MSFENGYTGAPFAQTQEDIQQRADWIQFMEQGGDALPATQQGEPQISQISQATHHAEPSLHQPLPYLQQVFPNQQTEDISEVRDFKSQLPLARVKKIMKADEDVKMIAADVPAVFAKAGDPFTQTEEDIQRQENWIQLREQRGGGCPATQQGTPQIHQIFQATQHAEPSLHQPLPSQQQVFPNQQTEEISQVLGSMERVESSQCGSALVVDAMCPVHSNSLDSPNLSGTPSSIEKLENKLRRRVWLADIKNQFPLARVKKIMKADEDVKMITADAPAVLGKACELFIEDLTHQSWIHTHEKQRRTLKRNDIADAIARTDRLDFLIDIVPRDELR